MSPVGKETSAITQARQTRPKGIKYLSFGARGIAGQTSDARSLAQVSVCIQR